MEQNQAPVKSREKLQQTKIRREDFSVEEEA
jgi:hypothetical protein